MRINIEETDLNEDGTHYTYQGELFTGEIVVTDRAGTVVAVKPVVGGRQHGVERSWYPDGTLRREIPMDDGVVRGTSRRWHPNSRLAEEREFDDAGNWVAVRRWAEDGTVLESKRYD
jgi:antitoxin component YwqK of YwqJK toxin-antitoxin module